MESTLVVSLAAALVAATLAYLSPQWLARLREPEDAEDDKRQYAELAGVRGLAPALALAAAVVAGSVAFVNDSRAIVPLWVFLAAVGALLTFVDWHTRRLPTAIIGPSYAVVLILLAVAALLSSDWSSAGRSLATGAITFILFFGAWFVYPRGLGFGDVRLSGILGIALGWYGWWTVGLGIYAGFVLGAVLGLLLSFLKVVDAKGFPFGPFLLIGAWLGALFVPALGGSL